MTRATAPTSSANARAVLATLEQRARRRFGQHFLTDPGVVERIVRGARVEPGDRVVEIGPGLGVLTDALLAAGADLLAIELDRDLAEHLSERLPELRLVQADAARVDWDELLGDGPRAKVVANLPYNVGTTLTMQILRRPARFASVTVMLQREVVDRMCAEPGSRTYGALSVELQARARPTYVTLVPPDRFFPPPKVHSSVVRLDLFDAPEVGEVTPEHFDAVVRAAFSQRRKALPNSLGGRYGKERARAAVQSVGIDLQARAEQLDLPAFRALAAALDDRDGEGR
ncbi:MAG: 16S rRNA (adenine(1518)-N(6)/adenine(1519)-N(6))-dimethyltransferase RsmA [Myxococcota bacterium]